MNKTAAIFAFYDEDGIVDDYITHLLKSMREVISYQYVVVNGFLSPEGEKKLLEVCDEIIYRENQGFDISGYKHVIIDKYEELKAFDSVLLYNQTVFGPFNSLKKVFSQMEKRKLDFWGLTKFPYMKEAPTWAELEDGIPEHLQSYFLVINKRMFCSEDFISFMQNLPVINSYYDAVSKFEMRFTEHFEKLNYKSDSFIPIQAFDKVYEYPLMNKPVELIEKYKCPLAKRKSFVIDRNDMVTSYYGYASQELYDYIKTKTNYDFNMIKQNLLRTADYRSFLYSLTPCFTTKRAKNESLEDTILIVYVKNNLEIDTLKERLNSFKNKENIIVLCSDNKLKANFSEYTTSVCKDSYDFIFSRGYKIIKEYKYIAYITNAVNEIYDDIYDISSIDNAYKTLLSIAQNKKILENNDDYGLLLQYPSYKGANFTRGIKFKNIISEVEEIIKELKLNIPLNKKSYPLFCESGMFFAKVEILEKAKGKSLKKYEEVFDKSNITLKEILLPLLAQSSGYFTGYVFKEGYNYSDLLNMECMVRDFKNLERDDNRRYDIVLAKMQGKINHFHEHHNDMTLRQAFSANLSFKEKLYIIYHLVFNKEM